MRRCAAVLGMAAGASAQASQFSTGMLQVTDPPLEGWGHPEVQKIYDLPTYNGTNCTSGNEGKCCRKFGGVTECTVGTGTQGAQSRWRCGHSTGGTGIAASTQKWAQWSPYAGIEMLRGDAGKKSLDWVRQDEVTNANTPAANRQYAKDSAFDGLFCADYLRRYLNPRENAGEFAGVCIRDLRMGYRWAAIVAADSDAHAYWERFGNVKGNPHVPLTEQFGGYQKSTPLHKTTKNTSWNSRWGSGAIGSIPVNWCGSYMKEMLCHIAFPQYAGGVPPSANWNMCPHDAAPGDVSPGSDDFDTSVNEYPLTWPFAKPDAAFTDDGKDHGNSGPACPSNGAIVRPVCNEACEKMFTVCNRYESCYDDTESPYPICKNPYKWAQRTYTGNPAGTQPYLNEKGGVKQFLQADGKHGGINPDNEERAYRENNWFFCNVWNRGYSLAQAGTGVGYGGDTDVDGPDGSSRFCATWEAGPRSAPFFILSMLAAAIAAAVSCL